MENNGKVVVWKSSSGSVGERKAIDMWRWLLKKIGKWKLRIEKIGKIGNFVLKNTRKNRKINSTFFDIDSLPAPHQGYNVSVKI